MYMHVWKSEVQAIFIIIFLQHKFFLYVRKRISYQLFKSTFPSNY